MGTPPYRNVTWEPYVCAEETACVPGRDSDGCMTPECFPGEQRCTVAEPSLVDTCNPATFRFVFEATDCARLEGAPPPLGHDYQCTDTGDFPDRAAQCAAVAVP